MRQEFVAPPHQRSNPSDVGYDRGARRAGVRGPSRDFFQGLIQVDAAIIHTQRGHWGGVANLLARSLGHLEQCPDSMLGMDVARLRNQLRAYRREILVLKEGRKEAFDGSLCPDLAVEGIDQEALITMEDEHATHPVG